MPRKTRRNLLFFAGYGPSFDTFLTLCSMIRVHCHLESELARNPDIYHEGQKRTNQHRLVRSTVFNFALISVLALLFVFTRFGFNLRLFILLVVRSAFFVSLTLFTGRQSSLHADVGIAVCERGAQRQGDGSPNTPIA